MEPEEISEKQKDQPMDTENQMELKNIALTISFEDSQINIDRGTFRFNDSAFHYSTESVNLDFRYQDTTSFGTSQLQLIIFLKDPEAQNEDAQPNHDLFDLIKECLNSKKIQHFNMSGPYQISIDFTPYGKQTLTEVYNKLNEYSAMNEDDQADPDFPELDQMITADDIDEHGNIINKQDSD